MFNVAEIISAAEIILFQFQTWLHVKQNTEVISKLFQNNLISHVTTVYGMMMVIVGTVLYVFLHLSRQYEWSICTSTDICYQLRYYWCVSKAG